jgi:AcrR family transcriptional regulator
MCHGCYSDVTAVAALPSDDPRILAAARQAIERHGWRDATMERIAGEAGLSRMTLHRRGITRDAVLAGLAQALEADYRGAMWPALTAPGTARERLEQALEALCDVCDANLGLLAALGDSTRERIFHEAAEFAGANSPASSAKPARDVPSSRREPGQSGVLTRSVFTEPVERLLRDGMADGSLREADPVETATVLFNLVSWTYRHLRQGHGWPSERARRGVLALALDGVAA